MKKASYSLIKKASLTLIAVLALIVAGVACSTPDPEDIMTLRMNYNDKDEFMSRYGNFIQKKMKGLTFEIIETPQPHTIEDFTQFVQEEALDIVWMDYSHYTELSHADALAPLPLEEIKDFAWIPEEFIRQFERNGNYDALPTDFQTPVIFYNKNVFEEHGVDLPVDQMTWDEVIALAQRFPEKWGLNGFYGGPIEYVLQNIAFSLGGNIYSTDMNRLAFESEAWRQAWLLTAEGYKSQAFRTSQSGFEEFSIGRTAMFYTNVFAIEPMRKKAGKVEIGIVSQPIQPERPEEFPLYTINIYGVHANSANQDKAWEVVKRIDELTFLKPKENVPARVKAWEEKFNIDLSPAYELQLPVRTESHAKAPELAANNENWEQQWLLYLRPLLEEHMDMAIDGKMTPVDSYERFVKEADAAWQQFLSNLK